MAEFKERLKQLRKEKKMTQVRLGELLNYGYTAIANYESGRNQPAITDLKKIAAIFDVSLDYLLGVSDTRQPYNINQDPEKWNQFLRYYSLLNSKSLNELLLFMQWLTFKEEKEEQDNINKTTPYNEPYAYRKPTAIPSLRVAQNSKEYKKD